MAANITDRKCLAAGQIAEIWHRWQAGELITRIAEALNRPYMTVHSQIQCRISSDRTHPISSVGYHLIS
jgi:hypothetical protein